MVTARIPLTIERGETFVDSGQLLDKNSNPIPIPGYAGRGQVKDDIGGTLLLTFTVTVLDPAQATYQITATDTATASVASSYARGKYDIELFNGIGVIKAQKGTVKFTGEITT